MAIFKSKNALIGTVLFVATTGIHSSTAKAESNSSYSSRATTGSRNARYEGYMQHREARRESARQILYQRVLTEQARRRAYLWHKKITGQNARAANWQAILQQHRVFTSAAYTYRSF